MEYLGSLRGHLFEIVAIVQDAGSLLTIDVAGSILKWSIHDLFHCSEQLTLKEKIISSFAHDSTLYASNGNVLFSLPDRRIVKRNLEPLTQFAIFQNKLVVASESLEVGTSTIALTSGRAMALCPTSSHLYALLDDGKVLQYSTIGLEQVFAIKQAGPTSLTIIGDDIFVGTASGWLLKYTKNALAKKIRLSEAIRQINSLGDTIIACSGSALYAFSRDLDQLAAIKAYEPVLVAPLATIQLSHPTRPTLKCTRLVAVGHKDGSVRIYSL